ncbi:hypothetical protein QVD17_35858 [Tagetes erecta]|uniref:Protein kinase domain-containing protein n=1 Tax=Tagetes erecta TaxID=13708 RepID=A0AAD8JV64_TARER|nr:hypothetical protein QVD17_35858 [Tagetes erecta]
MVAHIGDFGLTKFLPLKPHQSSSIGIRGTTGYAAPEYGVGNEMTKEGDIYSFGILLLEMITEKRPTDPIFQEGLNLHGYVKMALPGHLMEIIEPMLFSTHMKAENGYNMDEERRLKRMEDGMISFARIGLACSMESPEERMNTSTIIHELHRSQLVSGGFQDTIDPTGEGVKIITMGTVLELHAEREIGSSTMPHKVNPIAGADVNEGVLNKGIDNSWEVLAEPIHTVCIVPTCVEMVIPAEAKTELFNLTPHNYVGVVAQLEEDAEVFDLNF